MLLVGCTELRSDHAQRVRQRHRRAGRGLRLERSDLHRAARSRARPRWIARTSAYTCGVDDRCHAPGGTLGAGPGRRRVRVERATGSPISIRTASATSSACRARRSSCATAPRRASCRELESTLTPTQTGPASFGDLDGDGSLDVAITTPDGIVAYTSPYGTLSPLDVNNLIADPNATAGARRPLRVHGRPTRRSAGSSSTTATTRTTARSPTWCSTSSTSRIRATGAPCGQLIDQTDLSPDEHRRLSGQPGRRRRRPTSSSRC